MTPRYKIQDVEDALRASSGNYAASARILAKKYGSCCRNTVKNYVLKHESLRVVAEDVKDVTLDLAEDVLVTAIKNGELRAVFFYLEHMGRNRGWVRRMETTGKDGGPIQTEEVTRDAEEFSGRMARLSAAGDAGGGTGEVEPGGSG